MVLLPKKHFQDNNLEAILIFKFKAHYKLHAEVLKILKGFWYSSEGLIVSNVKLIIIEL